MSLDRWTQERGLSAKFNARSVAEAARVACFLEAYVPKPGNVHPGASFADLEFVDFVQAGELCAPILQETPRVGVGRAVFECVRATRSKMDTNPNLGIVLLLAPLAAVPETVPLVAGIGEILSRLTVEDARLVYAAIRLAKPGGLGSSEEQDVHDEPTETLLAVMIRAGDRDLVARQYAEEFELVLSEGLTLLQQGLALSGDLETAVIGLQLRLLARHPDSLIARKCGLELAMEASGRARRVLELGWPESTESARELVEFDRWLRADGHRRNPGTTADLVAAILFAGLRDRLIVEPEFVSRTSVPRAQ